VDQSALNIESSRYRQLVDAITDYAIYMLDSGGHVVSWNPGAQRFKGYLADEVVGQHFSRFYTEEDRATGMPSRALAAAANEGRFENEGWRVRKDGTRFWAHVIIDPIREADGEVVGYAKVTRDLTERMEATEALKRSQEQFQILVNGVTDYAIYMLDPQGHVTNWNSGAERIKGYSREEILGSHVSRFYTVEDREAGLPQRALGIAGDDGRFESEGWRVRKDGSRFWAHVIVDSIRAPSGDVVGFAKVTRDITERMEHQRELEAAREALFQAQKLEALGQLTGGIAHDFNNLLAAVLGSLELLRKRLPDDPRITPLLDNAVMGAERGAILTQRMLAFARKQALHTEAVDLAALARGMLDFAQRSLGPTVVIETDFPEAIPPVMTDPAQLEAAVLNLAVNARDAMPDGGVLRLAAKTRRTRGTRSLQAGDYVCLTVTDTGEGMDAETLSKAADPFFTTKGVGKGTGLGLSMVHGLMLQTGGALEIRSVPGQGSTVELWLPLASGDIRGAEQAVEPAEAAPLEGLQVLAVDDDPLVLMNTQSLLEDLGCRVEVAASGADALRLLGEDLHFDLMLSDQVMPEMSGGELMTAARLLRPDLPVIIATGFTEDLDHPLEPRRLQKPFSQTELETAVRAAVPAGRAAT
jgi:PAS domain S-box-containing protein